MGRSRSGTHDGPYNFETMEIKIPSRYGISPPAQEMVLQKNVKQLHFELKKSNMGFDLFVEAHWKQLM